jgi:uncharacterized membrane protein YczE
MSSGKITWGGRNMQMSDSSDGIGSAVWRFFSSGWSNRKEVGVGQFEFLTASVTIKKIQN